MEQLDAPRPTSSGGAAAVTEELLSLLVEAVVEYAIFLLSPDGNRGDLERGRATDQGIPR